MVEGMVWPSQRRMTLMTLRKADGFAAVSDPDAVEGHDAFALTALPKPTHGILGIRWRYGQR